MLVWDKKKEAKLIEMKAKGASSSKIAAVIGVSKDSVVGKSRRMGLEKGVVPPKEIHSRPNHNTNYFASDDSSRKSFKDTKITECHWIYNDDLLCAKPIKEGSPYCDHHCKIAYKRYVNANTERAFVTAGKVFK